MNWIKIEFGKEPKEDSQRHTTAIDYQMITDAIVQANINIENAREIKVEKEKQEILANRKRILKEKDFSHITCPIWREVRIFFNNIRVIWNMLTLTPEEAQYFTAVNELTRLLASLLLYAIGLGFYALAGFFIFKCVDGFTVAYIPYVIFSIVIARLIRIARFEVDRMKNEAQLANVAMLLVALITLVATVAGLVISVHGSN